MYFLNLGVKGLSQKSNGDWYMKIIYQSGPIIICKLRQPKLWVSFCWHSFSWVHLNGGWDNKRLYGDITRSQSKDFISKMNLRCNWLLYLCLVYTWAASGIISAEFANHPAGWCRNAPRHRTGKWETKIKQSIYSWKSLLDYQAISPYILL